MFKECQHEWRWAEISKSSVTPPVVDAQGKYPVIANRDEFFSKEIVTILACRNCGEILPQENCPEEGVDVVGHMGFVDSPVYKNSKGKMALADATSKPPEVNNNWPPRYKIAETLQEI